MTEKQKAYAMLHLLVLIWSFTAILGLLIDLQTPVMVVYRTALAAMGIWLIMKLKGIEIRNKDAWKFLLTGVLVALHWLLFFGSAKVSNVSISLAGFSSQALFTSFIEPILNKKKIEWLQVMFGLFVILGLYLIFQFEFQYSLGLWMSIGCALMGALFSVINGMFAHKHAAETVVFYEMTGASLTALFFIPFILDTSAPDFKFLPSLSDWLWLLLLAWGCTVFPFTQSVKLLKQLSAFMINHTLNLEPVYGVCLAYLIFGEKERMTPGFYVGGGLVLATVVLYPILKNNIKKAA